MSAVAKGRLCIIVAAILWSLGGAFTKVLTEDTAFGLNEPPLERLSPGAETANHGVPRAVVGNCSAR